jgi:hypothetical protein
MKNILIILILASTIYSQFYKRSVMDTNQVESYFSNRASIFKVGPSHNPLMWPDSNGLNYIYNWGFLIAGEVFNNDSDMLHIVDDGFLLSDDGDFRPGTIEPWGWIPLSGYDNPESSQVALSNDTTTWPPSWQAWPGLNGNGILRADQETFWVMNDSSNAEFAYYPMLNDSSYRGLGLQVSCRGYEWIRPAFEDFIIFTFAITNVSDRTISKLSAGVFCDPYIGDYNDFSDDRIAVDWNEDMVYCWDQDSLGNNGIIPGVLGFLTLESPDQIGLTSAVAVFSGGPNRPKNDELMWDFMTPGTDSILPQPADYVLVFGSGYFSLQPGETKNYAVGLIFGEDLPELYYNVDQARAAYSLITEISHQQVANFPVDFSLESCYPNPFNPRTIIPFHVRHTSKIILAVYDILGRPVRTLYDGIEVHGQHQSEWDGRDEQGKAVASGIYIVRLQAGNISCSRKILLLR